MEQAQPVRVRFPATTLPNCRRPTVEAVGSAPGAADDWRLVPENLEDRILIKIDQVPPYLLETLVPLKTVTSISHLVCRRSRLPVPSGSTLVRPDAPGRQYLTQQLVKNFYLTNERSLSRKLTEAMMAMLLELHYDKREILEAYLNEVFVGQDGQRAVHGFGLASQFFFSQPLSELKLHQVALLVGMVKGPSSYNPRRYPERALERRNLVLDVLPSRALPRPSRLKPRRRCRWA
jgi:penicillin-binding protein 1B